jgi:hypothetical protein
MLTYDVLMSSIAYTFVCAGISYLSNLSLTIVLDLGKRRWMLPDRSLRKIRTAFHVFVALVNASIIGQYTILYILTGKK